MNFSSTSGNKFYDPKLTTLLISLALLITSYAILLSSSSSRLFLPYFVLSYIFAAYVWRKNSKNYGPSLESYLFPSSVWLHPSSINDYKLFLFNYVFYFHFVAFVLMNLNPIQDGVLYFLDYIHTPKSNSSPGFFAGFVLALSILLLTELVYYATHRAYHTFPFLWELHKVHHSAEVMTPITYIRSHPIDLLIQNSGKLIITLLCTGVFLHIYPNPDGVFMAFCIDIGAIIYAVTGAALHHSHIWISFGPKIEHILISPAQHQIHHSNNPKHFDRNYGSMLAIWDWIFGSLYVPQKYEKIEFGLGKEEQRHYSTTRKLLLYPIKEMFRILVNKLPKK